MKLLIFLMPMIISGDVIKDDFLVHPDLPEKCEKKGAWVTALPQGWAVVWSDYRNPGGIDVYAQKLGQVGAPVDVNFRVNTSAADQGEVAGKPLADGEGNFIIPWEGKYKDWFVRRFSPSGEPLSDEAFLGKFDDLTMAMNASGEYVRVWKGSTGSHPRPLMLQVFNSDDSPKGDSQEVARPEYAFPHTKAAIAPDGSSVIVWQDEKDSIRNVFYVFARCFDADGLPKGEAFQVNVEEGASYPEVGIDAEGDFVVAWRQQESEGFGVHFRRYNANGTPKDEPVRAHGDLGGAEIHYTLSIAVADGGNFAVLWSDNRTGSHRVYLQNFLLDGASQGPELMLSSEDSCLASHLAIRGNEWCAVYIKGEVEVLARTGTIQGELGDQALITDDESSVYEVSPQVFAEDEGNFLVTWEENVYPEFPVYARWFDAGGNPEGDPFRIGRYGNGAMNPVTGEFAVMWKEKITDISQVYVQRYHRNGLLNGDMIELDPVQRDLGSWFGCDVDMNRSGEFTAAWLVSGGSVANRVVARRFDAAGISIDPDLIEVSAYSGDPKSSLAVEMTDDDGFIAAWSDGRDDGVGDIYARRFDAAGQPIGADFKVSDDTLTGLFDRSYQRYPCIASDSSGNFCIAWAEDGRLKTGDCFAYAQFYDSNGNKLGNNVRTYILHSSFLNISIAAAPQGGYVIFGTDYSNVDGDPEVCAHFYSAEGISMTRKTQINQPDLFSYNHQLAEYNTVSCTDDRIVFVWLDNRRHKGWDVYAKVTDWDEFPGVEEGASVKASQIKLASTLNRLSWDVPGEAVLTVYNSAGRRVAEEVIRGKGSWQAVNVPSGVYFARIAADCGSAREKVIVVK